MIHSQVTLWRFKVINTDPEGQHSDVDPLGQTPGQHLDTGLCIQGQGHSWRQSSQDRTHLSISRSTSAHKSVTWCSRSLIRFHIRGPGSHVWAGCGHTGPCTPLPPYTENYTMHWTSAGMLSRSQDHDPLHWTTWICPLKVIARHTDTHTWAGFVQPRPNAHTLSTKVRNWAKGPGRDGGTRMWWTRGLTRERWGCPSEKGGGCRLSSWAPRLHLASPSQRRVEAPAGCSRQAGGGEERAGTEPKARLAAG